MSEAVRQIAEMTRKWSGLQPCCGATNRVCDLPSRQVFELNTGCEECGHPLGCHVRA